MPVYTSEMPVTTLPNNIRPGNPNPNVEPVLGNDSIFVEIERSLDTPFELADGKTENYRRPYYRNLFSSPTTAGYTQMKQIVFVKTTGIISGYQTGIPFIR